ncbi:hypothetical protein [Heyndrickxia coagulans]|uniref:Uncharacterized protein n=1 Tax=Heyndrickxia coagulans DSM 1 = ATCC 7050 TaxID=1121088 RepID=A0A0B5WSH5_HEYCO|nr:hypothetical protein [Heyndrickxia coagulans]AJH78865.1 helix-turn-helix domain protein [Heyndrickxia coagulans DSM 1 = ATCC 7050]AJH79214.1 helix-turn-helix domain protein [Heyndrickxia coagulans DSM 1 = ATCC 7050]MCR2847342.1 helix-turn-helix domain-containing protein [Heyndrickxia coagulans]MDR4225167.1 hypothetical protein [Heyndrickxia coagulans DSM 1 = ATCC 7050]MED4492946.1 hypothetical protein [Heyndrickxia coagulans]
MANIYRVQKNGNYVVMNKTSLMDERLSWKAKGLHAYMLSLPDDWRFYDTELQKHAKDGRDSLRTALKELRDLGYLKRVQHRNEDGTFNYETLVFEVPQMDQPLPGKPLTENPLTEKPLTDYPSTENPKLLSNKELSIDELNNNGLNNEAAAVNKLLNRFIELRNHGFVATPKDKAAADEIIQYGVNVDDAIKWMEEKFASYQPKHPKDYIKTLDYCAGYIFDRFIEKQEAERGEDNGTKIPKYRRSYGRPAGKSAEQAIREAEEARRAWGG